MERRNLSTLIDRPVRLLTSGRTVGGQWAIEVRDLNTDELLAEVGDEDFFDPNGNRFTNDTE